MHPASPIGRRDLHERFGRDGLVVLPGFYSPGRLTAINAALDAHYARWVAALHGGVPGRDPFACDVIPWDPCRDGHELFLALRGGRELVDVTEAVTGPGFTAPSSLVMYSVSGGRGQAWHQDCPDGDAAAYNVNRLVYTRDVALADGAIVVVPGSHRLGRIPPGGHQDPMPGEVALTPPAGTLVLLHGHVCHRVTPNTSAKPRVSVNFRAYPAGVDPAVNCVGVYRNGTVNFCDQPRRHDGRPAEANGS